MPPIRPQASARMLEPTVSLALKVPEITVAFWIVKLPSTALGESTTDYLVFQIDCTHWDL